MLGVRRTVSPPLLGWQSLGARPRRQGCNPFLFGQNCSRPKPGLAPCECSAGKTSCVSHGLLLGGVGKRDPAAPLTPPWSFNNYECTCVESGGHRCTLGPSSLYPGRKWTQEASVEPVLYRSLPVLSVCLHIYTCIYIHIHIYICIHIAICLFLWRGKGGLM